jgi:hypothetical protein
MSKLLESSLFYRIGEVNARAKLRSFRASKLQSFKASELQRFRASKLQSFKGPELQGPQVATRRARLSVRL